MVRERDAFGNATVIVPSETQREFGVTSERSYQPRFNIYSNQWPTSPF
jgi:hypothetical protein